MGFFDHKVFGPLEDMFDLNRDGKLDLGEQAFMFETMEEEERMIEREMRGSSYDFDDDDDDDFDDEF